MLYSPNVGVILLVLAAEFPDETGGPAHHEEARGRPCQVNRTRAPIDATVANHNDCRPRESSAVEATIRATAVVPAYVSLTTLTAPQEARAAYEQATRELARKNPDYAKAIDKLQRAVRVHPSFAAAWHRLGEAELALRDIDGAERAFRRALDADPRSPGPYLPLALLELKRGRLDEAARMADAVLKILPNLTEARFYSATAHYNLGDTAVARRSILSIISSGDDKRYPRVHAMLGEMLADEGNFRSAAEEYRRLLELEPDSRIAGAARGQLEKWQAKGLID